MAAYTLFHVVLSAIALGAGVVVVAGMIASERRDVWTAVFLAATVLTSVTGFFFPFHALMPSHATGIISLAILAAVIPARYIYHFEGRWRRVYVVGTVLALYLNVFVLVVQLFQKVPALHALAPAQTAPAFQVVQLAVMVLFVMLTGAATKRFLVDPPSLP